MPFIIITVILALDQFSKFIVTKKLLLHQPFAVIKGVFSLTLVHNRGAAFGILNNQVPLFIITSLFAVALLYSQIRKNNKKGLSLYTLSLSLILSGALGNLIDRASLGYVIDFLDFHIWPVFNVADSAISVGTVLLGYSILVKRSK